MELTAVVDASPWYSPSQMPRTQSSIPLLAGLAAAGLGAYFLLGSGSGSSKPGGKKGKGKGKGKRTAPPTLSEALDTLDQDRKRRGPKAPPLGISGIPKEVGWTSQTDKIAKDVIRQLYDQMGKPAIRPNLVFELATNAAEAIFPDVPWPVGGSEVPGHPGFFIFDEWYKAYGVGQPGIGDEREGWWILKRLMDLALEQIAAPLPIT